MDVVQVAQRYFDAWSHRDAAAIVAGVYRRRNQRSGRRTRVDRCSHHCLRERAHPTVIQF